MIKDKQILEALQVQPLSEEEKASKHILARLYGPIATCTENTRNGRKYNKELWEKALSDEVFQEKVKTKSLFLELGHPVDREETDMTKVCACIPEMPKIMNGDLYAYVDILDTDNGRLLKTLCDYGFVPGISSRGSGDIMGNNEVDPDTFFLETWDIVQLPAVKKARLAVCESFDRNANAMRKALAESLNKANAESKKVMEEALGNLNITLDEAAGMDDEVITKNGVNFIFHRNPATVPEGKFDLSLLDKDYFAERLTEENEEPKDTEDVENIEVEAPVEEVEEIEVTEDEAGEKDLLTLVQEKIIPEDEIKGEADEGYNKAINEVLELIAAQTEEQTDDKSVEDIEENSDDQPVAETDESPEEAVDDGADEVIESLKDMVRQKDLLEAEVKSLKNEKTVSDTKAAALAEELDKYKTAFGRVSELASKSTKFEKQVKELNEQLNAKDAQITELKNKAINNTALNESINKAASEKAKLTQKIFDMQSEMQETEKKLNEQLSARKAEVEKKTKIALSYKAKFESVVNKYIDTKASMLGIQSSEIRNRLTEQFSLEDVDKVCEEFLSNTRAAKLPFVGRNSGTVMTESKGNQKFAISKNDDLYDLYELAGLN